MDMIATYIQMIESNDRATFFGKLLLAMKYYNKDIKANTE